MKLLRLLFLFLDVVVFGYALYFGAYLMNQPSTPAFIVGTLLIVAALVYGYSSGRFIFLHLFKKKEQHNEESSTASGTDCAVCGGQHN